MIVAKVLKAAGRSRCWSASSSSSSCPGEQHLRHTRFIGLTDDRPAIALPPPSEKPISFAEIFCDRFNENTLPPQNLWVADPAN
jgi:hypothetical protein